MAYLTDSFDSKVVELLQQGSVGFMPSGTIYGLSCLALNKRAVQKIHNLKDRSQHKPFIVLIDTINMLNLLSIDKKQVEPAIQYWPGGLTLICQAENAPTWLQLGTKTLAIRIPDNPQLCQLIDKVGPLVSTSANIQNQQPLSSAAAAKKQFAENLDFYVDAGQMDSRPSTIARLANGKLEIIRRGAVKINEKEVEDDTGRISAESP